jgi:hypothetical protein
VTRKQSTFSVARRFCGPSNSANGGYICGVVAQLAPWPATVRLMKPPPLDAPLTATERAGVLEVVHGEVVAQARPGTVGDLVPPSPPSYEQAAAASRRYAGFAEHPAPTCFVCGPRRTPGDGLCIFPGPVARVDVAQSTPATTSNGDSRTIASGDDSRLAGSIPLVAAPWVPDSSLDNGDGNVAIEFIWAALDCPGYIAVAGDMRSMLLGELTAEVDRPVRVGERCTVIGWKIAAAGRKYEAGTALFDAQGRLCARARAVWIEPRKA